MYVSTPAYMDSGEIGEAGVQNNGRHDAWDLR